MNHPKIEAVDFGSNDIYIYIPFPLFLSVYVYTSLCDFVCIALLLPFVLEFCLLCFFWFVSFLSIVFTTCNHWWICFFGLIAFLFLSFFSFCITF